MGLTIFQDIPTFSLNVMEEVEGVAMPSCQGQLTKMGLCHMLFRIGV